MCFFSCKSISRSGCLALHGVSPNKKKYQNSCKSYVDLLHCWLYIAKTNKILQVCCNNTAYQVITHINIVEINNHISTNILKKKLFLIPRCCNSIKTCSIDFIIYCWSRKVFFNNEFGINFFTDEIIVKKSTVIACVFAIFPKF